MAFPNELMTEQADSPMIKESWDYIDVERRYQVKGRFTRAQLVSGEYVPSLGYKDPETDALYVDYSYDSEVAYPVLVIHFKKRVGESISYDLNDYSINRPIERHDDFKMCWRYELYGADTSTALPAWSTTAIDKSNTEGQEIWAWSKTGPTAKQPNLRQEQEADKVGIDSYLVQGAVLTKKKVYTMDTGANGCNRWVNEIGKLCRPNFQYGLFPSSDYWLIRSYRIVGDFDEFATTLEWIYSPDKWDTDIYKDSSVTDD